MRALWEPSPERVAESRIDRLRRDLAEATGEQLADTRDLYRFSLEHPGDFWDVIWDECGIRGDRGDGPAYVLPPAGADLRRGRFFPAASLNFAENLLAGGERCGAGELAIIARSEHGQRRDVTWTELRAQAEAFARFLLALGVSPGDRVAAWMPNVPETVVAMLGTTMVGAVFTSTSPDFGAAGVVDRFGQVEPKVLIASDGYRYAGKEHDRSAVLAQVVSELPSVVAVVVHGELGVTMPELQTDLTFRFDEVVASRPDAPIAVQEFPVDHPAYILYSSGTTGAPKCIVHRAGGLLLKHLVEHQLHCDVRAGDRVFYFTTCGWMMWNWLVGALASGATIVLYDGSPFQPDGYAMWDLVQDYGVTLFGTSAKFIDASMKAEIDPRNARDLAALRTICSTGSPLNPEGFDYVYEHVKADVHLASISGGTDLCGCLVLGDPTRPVFRGEIQGPALGVNVDVWAQDGTSLHDQPGNRGELVVTQAFPSMPLKFWNDPDNSRYTQAYFSRFPQTWAQGDFAAWTEAGGIVIYGRSDSTLNAGGVRIGTAEIYRQVEQLPEVVESLAIGQEWDGDTRIVLFVVLAAGQTLGSALETAIKTTLRTRCSPRHVPGVIVAVADLPRTRSGKLAEIAVADVIHGRPVRNAEALANPESLALFVDLPELS